MKNFGTDLNAVEVSMELEKHFNLESSDYTQGFFGGICKVISQMRYYQEEGTHIQFRLAVGIDDGKEGLPRLYKLQYQSIEGKSKDEITEKVFHIIKKVLPCCKDNNDVYIVLDLNKKELRAGIFFLELNMVDRITHGFLDAGFIIAECLRENSICIHFMSDKKIDRCLIKLDLEDDNRCVNTLLQKDYENQSLSIQYWKGVFEQVKRCCHGTICLVVDNEFNLSDTEIKKLFTNSLKKVEDIAVIPNYFGENGSEESDHALQIFLSMLNYDGITIIDTLGRIISYNNICRNGEQQAKAENVNLQCGSRHVAYNQMKDWKYGNLVGVYFQSQEGEIHFYNYKTETESDFFDARIMNYVDRETFENAGKIYITIETIKKHSLNMTPNVASDVLQDYTNFMSYVYGLANTHIGINNFYREKDAAEKLQWIFNYPDWQQWIYGPYTTDERYRLMQNNTLDVVLACMVGNCYGYAESAQDVLKDIFNRIPDEWIKNYFLEKFYLNSFLLQDLRFKKPNDRWKEYIKDLVKTRLQFECGDTIDRAFRYSVMDFHNYYFCMSAFGQGMDPKDYDKFVSMH